MSRASRLFLGLQLLKVLAGSSSTLLAVDHHLEALEVVEGSTLLLLREALGPGSFVPLGLDVSLLESLLHVLLAGTAKDVDGELGEGEATEVDLLSAQTRTIDPSSVAINHVQDNAKLANLGTIVDVGNTSNLNKLTERLHKEERSISTTITTKERALEESSVQEKKNLLRIRHGAWLVVKKRLSPGANFGFILNTSSIIRTKFGNVIFVNERVCDRILDGLIVMKVYRLQRWFLLFGCGIFSILVIYMFV